jgi:hypothetical protein
MAAEKFKGRITGKDGQSGTVVISYGTVGDVVQVEVDFTVPFDDIPDVTVSAHTTLPQNVRVGTSDPTTSGFIIYYYRSAGTGSFQVSWIARRDHR